MPDSCGKRRARWRFAFLFAILVLQACAKDSDFGLLLARIDHASPGRDVSAIFRKASSLALSSQNHVSLLKRAFARNEPELFADLAVYALKKLPLNESIARVAVRAFIDAGRPSDALAMFPDPLEPGQFPSLYAESLLAYFKSLSDESGLASRRFDSGPTVDELALGWLFGASGESRAAFDAALLRLANGDISGARLYADAAMKAGYVLDAETAWDLGFLDKILESPPGSDAASLCRYADACVMSNRIDAARSVYLKICVEYPRYSWVPYIVLARFERDRDRAELWISGMLREFADNAAAVQAASAYYAGSGEAERALSIIKPLALEDHVSGAVELAVLDLLESKERLGAFALVYAERFSREALAADFSALTLELKGLFYEGVQVFNRATACSLVLPRGYFHKALAALVDNDYASALSLLERGGAAEGGFAPLYDVGIVYMAARDYGKAVERLEVAALNSHDKAQAAKAFLALAKAKQFQGDQQGSRAALRAALDANPLLGEASFLLGKE